MRATPFVIYVCEKTMRATEFDKVTLLVIRIHEETMRAARFDEAFPRVI